MGDRAEHRIASWEGRLHSLAYEDRVISKEEDAGQQDRNDEEVDESKGVQKLPYKQHRRAGWMALHSVVETWGDGQRAWPEDRLRQPKKGAAWRREPAKDPRVLEALGRLQEENSWGKGD